jgi:hypothetical protein
VSDAAETAVAGGDLRLQHSHDAVAEAQIGMPDDAGAQPALAVAAARGHRCRAIDEFDFADRLYLARAVGAVRRTTFDKDAVRDVVAAAGVGQQLVEKVAVPVAIPQVMVRIDDLERRLQYPLLPLRPPRRIAVARCGRSTTRDGHGGICLRLHRGRAKNSATQHPRRTDQHRATRYRTPANRLLSYRRSSKLF